MNKIFRKYVWCILLIFIGVVLLFLLFSGKCEKLGKVSEFLMSIENKTFDIRQRMTADSRKHSENIVVLAIDDNTYEYIMENYGEWPMPRYIYADVVEYIEKQNPDFIAFDLLFVKSLKSSQNDDLRLSELFKKYKNLYTAISFDDMKAELRTPPVLDEKFKVNLNNEAEIKLYNFSNHRPILKTITDNTQNVGHINLQRANDGVIREYYPFVKYRNDVYPHMSLLLIQDKFNKESRDYTFSKDLKLKFEDNAFPITQKGTVFLNWYGQEGTFEYISMAEVIVAAENQKKGVKTELDNKFKNKIIYVGTTVSSLHDIKTVPTSQNMAGVETHATFINNAIDNNFIHKLTFEWDFIITLFMCLFIGITMLSVEYSKINYKYLVPINSTILGITLILYQFVALKLMQYFNLWIAVIMPTVGIVMTFTTIYIIRYFFKSKDYEYTYRLATTDGLTELYNHRFFQEKMIECIEECEKNGKNFSLILTDIDFFKKFNDKYGHQAGDAVLRQVAKTLKKNVKKIDYVCRYGGEEMSIILRNVDYKSAIVIAQRLCDAVSGTICKLSDDLETNVTISLGVSTYPQHGKTPTEMIEYSDRGLYIAKENGRNQVGLVKENENNVKI